MSKPIVSFRPSEFPIVAGQPAYVFPIDHPSTEVSNKSLVRTSTVLEVGSTTFETMNTIYVQVE